MPDPVQDGATSAGSFLARKAGPFPVWAWLALAVGGYLWWQNRQQQQAASASAVPNQQTDPAGNVGTIDPATGYVYGTPEDVAALTANNAGTTSGTTSGTTTTGAQAYADNNSWGIAAVNYLVGLGIDASTANQAIQLYLTSQSLTPAQQGDVNLAIGALGPPPTLPGPVTGSVTPVTTPGSGTSGTSTAKSAPAPTGLVVTKKTATTASVKWNKSTGATGYRAIVHPASNADDVKDSADLSPATVTWTAGKLTAGTSYAIDVWAQPTKGGQGAPHATVTFSTPKASGKEPED